MVPSHLRLVKNDAPPTGEQDDSRGRESGPMRFLTRQPVIGANQQLVGYELKLRDSVPVSGSVNEKTSFGKTMTDAIA